MSRSLGAIRVDLIAGTAGFNKDVDTSKNKVEGLGTVLKGLKGWIVGAFAVLGVENIVHEFNAVAEAVEAIGRKSKALGVPVEQLSALKFAAGEAGVDFDQLSKIAGVASRRIAEFVNTGGGKAASALRELHIPLVDSEGKLRSIADLIPEIGAGLQDIKSPGEQGRLAEAIFGKGGATTFLQLLAEAGDNLTKLGDSEEKARRIGVAFTDDQVERLTEYAHSVYTIEQAWFGLKVNVAARVAPFFTDMVNRATGALAAIPDIVGNVAQKISDAFSPDEKTATSAKLRLEVFGTDLAATARDVGYLIGGSLALAMVGSFGDTLTDNSVTKKVALTWQATLDWIKQGMSGDPEQIRKTWDETYDELGNAFDKLSNAGWGEDDSTMSKFFDRMTTKIKRDVEDLGFSGEQVAGVMDALKKHAVDAHSLADRVHEVRPTAEQATEWWLFFDGVTKGFEEMGNAAADTGALGIEVSKNWTKSLSEGLASELVELKGGWKDLGKNIMGVLLDVTKALEKTILTAMIMRIATGAAAGIGSLFGFPAGGADLTPMVGGANEVVTGITPQKMGGAWSSGQMVPFANGAVAMSQGFFGMAGGRTGTFAEDGPEGILPLERVGGKLGVNASMMGGDVAVQIIDQRSGGEKPQVQRSRGPDGLDVVKIIIRDEVGTMIGDGSLDRIMGSQYGVSRRGVRR